VEKLVNNDLQEEPNNRLKIVNTGVFTSLESNKLPKHTSSFLCGFFPNRKFLKDYAIAPGASFLHIITDKHVLLLS